MASVLRKGRRLARHPKPQSLAARPDGASSLPSLLLLLAAAGGLRACCAAAAGPRPRPMAFWSAAYHFVSANDSFLALAGGAPLSIETLDPSGLIRECSTAKDYSSFYPFELRRPDGAARSPLHLKVVKAGEMFLWLLDTTPANSFALREVPIRLRNRRPYHCHLSQFDLECTSQPVPPGAPVAHGPASKRRRPASAAAARKSASSPALEVELFFDS